MKRFLFLPIFVLLLMALSACDSGDDDSDNDAGGPTAIPEPSITPSPPPTAVPTPTPQPVSEAVSRWGWKGFRGQFAFLLMSVRPGAEPRIDPWSFDATVYGANGFTVQCGPSQQPERWEFVECRGMGPNDHFNAAIINNETLELDFSMGGRTFREQLTRMEMGDEPESSPNVSLLWQAEPPASSGMNTGLWASDGVVFAPHTNGTVELLDANTGERLSTANVMPASGRGPSWVTEVSARDGILYAATTSRGVVIFDVRDPRQPRIIGQHIVDAGSGSLEAFTNVHTLFLGPDGSTLYAVNQSHATTDMRVIDVSNPAAPREAGRYIRPDITDSLDGFHDVHVIEREGRMVAFLHSLRSGLLILDVTNLTAISEIGSIKLDDTLSHSGAAFEAGGRLYYAHQDEGFDQAMTVLDVSDLTQPRVVGRFQTRHGTSIHNIDIVGTTAYVSYYVDGLRVVDLSDPTQPREIAHYDTVPATEEDELFEGAWGVKQMDGRVFISDTHSGVFGFEVSIP